MVRDAILQKITEKLPLPALVTETSNLYTDLHLDSLSFILLLREIEEEHAIAFELIEMQACLEVGELIALAEKKIEERGNDERFTAQAGE